MKSFFKKAKIEYLKKIIRIHKNNRYKNCRFKKINPTIDDIYLIRTKDTSHILNNINNLIVICHDVTIFENNVINKTLKLIIFRYKGEKLPENWNIKHLEVFKPIENHKLNLVDVDNLNKPESFKFEIYGKERNNKVIGR
jgi:hypothetical protein